MADGFDVRRRQAADFCVAHFSRGWRERVSDKSNPPLAHIVPFALLIGGIVATPTKAASDVCLFALLLCLAWGELRWRHIAAGRHQPVRHPKHLGR